MLKNIDELDVSVNHLFGVIPEAIGERISLEYLNLPGNSFNVAIPPFLVSLKGLRKLNLSRNNLSGLGMIIFTCTRHSCGDCPVWGIVGGDFLPREGEDERENSLKAI